MIRVEVIPYKRLDERHELAKTLEKERKQNKFKKVSDLGNCFYIEHFPIKIRSEVIRI
ncbi:hypothetical protein [Clostridium haemolyticum]|uniref:hypothetical protein n=1 Tax=Clostridium haemolyticum TaxID=84025 RepID=UPI000AE93126|nr:hypothetical protein [Clostridium haemolyticum]